MWDFGWTIYDGKWWLLLRVYGLWWDSLFHSHMYIQSISVIVSAFDG